eukprot:NODE_986_length_2785_cov_0.586001.p1 type:complete len:645 gc:universal NODE_986_length_2785_cov_0.586001:2483-549(-)
MRLLKPDISHVMDTIFQQGNRMPISSIDLLENFVATASEDTFIKIWDLENLVSNQIQSPKVLNYHQSGVNCVRFIDKDSMISCSSDGTLAQWFNFQVSGSISTGFEILDIAVSSDKSMIATCSITGDCIIYKLEKSPIQISVIHVEYPIKCLSFDPLKQFLTLLTTKELEIYDITQVKSPQLVQSFKKQIDRNFESLKFKLSYSPDGQLLAAPNCLSSKSPICLLIDRDMEETALVGHNENVICAAFSPKLYNRESLGDSICSIIATVSHDSVISFWMSCSYQPLLVIRETLFDDTILDISWHTDGLTVAICSNDGTVLLIKFSENELGRPLSEHEKEVHLLKKGISKVSSAPISLEELKLRNQPLPMVPKTALTPPVIPQDAASNVEVIQTQKVTIGKDGKKRIQPVVASSVPKNTSLLSKVDVPIYDIRLKSDDRLLLGSISVQTSVRLENVLFEIFNNSPEKNYCELRTNGIVGRIIESAPIIYLTHIESKLIAINEANELLIFSKNLRQLYLPIILDGALFCFCQKQDHFGILNQKGVIEIYSISDKVVLKLRCNIIPLLNNSEKIQRIELTNSFALIVHTYKASFRYDLDIKKWIRVSASSFEILNDCYDIKEDNSIFTILNAKSNMRKAATRAYLEVI